MALNKCRFVQHPFGVPTEIQRDAGDHHPSRQRGGAGAQPFSERDIVGDFKLDRGHRVTGVGRRT